MVESSFTETVQVTKSIIIVVELPVIWGLELCEHVNNMLEEEEIIAEAEL
jgi:hypothetical protein